MAHLTISRTHRDFIVLFILLISSCALVYIQILIGQSFIDLCLKYRIYCFQCSRDDIGDKMRKSIKDCNAVHIANPKTMEFQVTEFSVSI